MRQLQAGSHNKQLQRTQCRRAVRSDAFAACEVVRRSIVELCRDDHRDDESTLTEWLANKTPADFERWIASTLHAAYVAERDRVTLEVDESSGVVPTG